MKMQALQQVKDALIAWMKQMYKICLWRENDICLHVHVTDEVGGKGSCLE
jgi:hypothetical protein